MPKVHVFINHFNHDKIPEYIFFVEVHILQDYNHLFAVI